MTRRAHSRGTTLVELLASLLILALLAGGLHIFYATAARSVTILTKVSETREGARIAIEIIQRDLRGAGFSPDGWLDHGVLIAAEGAVAIAKDLNGDHDTSDANERIAYIFDAAGRRLMRRMGNAPPQPMLNDLAESGFRLTYRDNRGRHLGGSAGNLPLEQRKRIARIDILLALEVPNPDPRSAEPIRCRETATVSLRNDPPAAG